MKERGNTTLGSGAKQLARGFAFISTYDDDSGIIWTKF
jgi:hypothetical protein